MEPDLKNFEKYLHDVMEKFKSEIGGIRANRPTTKLVEDIQVDYFDQKMAVKQLGSVAIVPPRGITITFWDQGVIGPAAKAIETSGLGLSVAVEGKTIRLNLPPLTDERRREIIKFIKAMAETSRIRIRSLRDDINKKAKALADEDQKFKTLKRVQEIVDKQNEAIEAALENKIREINF